MGREPGACEAEIRPTREISVLVVDSNTASRSTTEILLRDCGFKASAVQSAKQALALLETRSEFDVVLKQHEPDQNIDATKFLWRIASSPHAAVKRIPCIVTSTCSEEKSVRRCLRLGALDYLIQPLRSNELLVLGARIARSNKGMEDAAAFSGSAAAISSGRSDGIETHEYEGSLQMMQQLKKSEAAHTGELRSSSDAGITQAVSARASANRNSTTKAGTNCQTPGDGSNVVNGHGSNNGNVVSTNHHYAFCSPYGATPLQQAYSIDRSGSGNRHGDDGDGSGQGSASGDQDLARRQLASESAELRAPSAAGTATAELPASDYADQGRSSIGNSGMVDAERIPAVAAHREVHDASKRGPAQGKREAPVEPAAKAVASSDGSQQPLQSPSIASRHSQQQKVHHDGSALQSVSVGFRAWVSQPPTTGGTSSVRHHQQASIGLKRKASCGLPPPIRPVPSSIDATRSNAQGSSQPVSSSGQQRFSSCGNTAASDGTTTHFANSSGVKSSSVHVVSSVCKETMPCPASHAVVAPPSPPPLVHHSLQNAAGSVYPLPRGSDALQHVHHSRQATLDRIQLQQQQASPSAAGIPESDAPEGPWNNAFTAALQQQLHQLQAQQQQQMNAQMRNVYASGSLQFGGMPPPSGYATLPYSAWAGYATAAQHASAGVQQQQQQQQQNLLSFAQQLQQQGGQMAGQQASEAAQTRLAQQHIQLQAQQMMMSGYNSAFLMGGQFGVGGSLPGGFGNFQAGWAHAQQAHMQQQLQQHGNMASQHPTNAAGVSMGFPSSSLMQGQQQGQPANPRSSAAVLPFSLYSPTSLAANISEQRPQPSTVVGDSEGNDAVNTDSGLTCQSTPKGFRAQAWSKFKEKRKNLNFTKKIRYESRKQLAQARPRIKGQFVRNGSNSQTVELLGEGPAPPTPAALAAAVAGGTARLVPQEEAAAMGLSDPTGQEAPVTATNTDDGNAAETVSDAISPRVATPTENPDKAFMSISLRPAADVF